MPLELPEGVTPCPHCTEPSEVLPISVTHGCPTCKYTGKANRWKVSGGRRVNNKDWVVYVYVNDLAVGALILESAGQYNELMHILGKD